MRAGERGYTMIAMLAFVVAISLTLTAAGNLWSQEAKRDRELELLRVGALYAAALTDYRNAAPGSLAEFPQRLDQLLLDDRFVGVRRHVRKLYPDPMNPARPWGLVLDDRQRVIGVYSQSDETPVSAAPRSMPGVQANASRYSEWKFMAEVK